MPVSKKRKKNGKKVKYRHFKDGGTKLSLHDRESHLTLQDLINVAAFQDYKAAGILDDQGKVVNDNIQTFDDRVREDMRAAGVDPDHHTFPTIPVGPLFSDDERNDEENNE